MSKGWFVNNNGEPLRFGRREDRPDLEADHTFVDRVTNPMPDLPQDSSDQYHWVDGSWVLQVDHLKPTNDQRIDRAFAPNDKDKILFDLLFDLVNRVRTLESKSALSAPQFKDALKAMLP